MKVKVCGITRMKDALLCESCGADALGFVFYRNSPRYVTPGMVKNIIPALSPLTVKVGVFVDDNPETINALAAELKLNLIQLHGNESPEYISQIELPVIKSFRIKNEFDFTILNNYQNAGFLLDSYSKKEFGGTGENFNWNSIPEWLKGKFILAGGISSQNIEYIFKNINPSAVDLSTALENEPGKKDETRIRNFFSTLNKLRKPIC